MSKKKNYDLINSIKKLSYQRLKIIITDEILSSHLNNKESINTIIEEMNRILEKINNINDDENE
jgi:hypothetical protein